MTRSCKSTRRHAPEILSNLAHLRLASSVANEPTMKKSLSDLMCTWLSRPCTSTAPPQPSHRVKRRDPFVCASFHTANVQFFAKANILGQRVSDTTYTRNKSTDDSTILFNAGENSYFGRIQSIFTLDDGQSVILHVSYLPTSNSFQCIYDEEKCVTYKWISQGQVVDLQSCLIRSEDFIEKCVFYENSSSCTFMRFPCLNHCS